MGGRKISRVKNRFTMGFALIGDPARVRGATTFADRTVDNARGNSNWSRNANVSDDCLVINGASSEQSSAITR